MIAWFCDTDPQDLFGSDEQMVYGNVKGQKKKKKKFSLLIFSELFLILCVLFASKNVSVAYWFCLLDFGL